MSTPGSQRGLRTLTDSQRGLRNLPDTPGSQRGRRTLTDPPGCLRRTLTDSQRGLRNLPDTPGSQRGLTNLPEEGVRRLVTPHSQRGVRKTTYLPEDVRKTVLKKCVTSLEGEDLDGKRALVRVDMNVPLDDESNIIDDTRIRAAVPTIKHLMQHGARVILASHLSNPDCSMKLLVPKLTELLGVEVIMANGCIGSEVENLVARIPKGGVLLLENLIRHREEVRLGTTFGVKLASFADLFVNDSFGIAHRSYTSTRLDFLRPAVAGVQMRKELYFLIGAVANPKRPLAAIIGGANLSTKIDMIELLFDKVDMLLIGGGLSFTFCKAKLGCSVGFSVVDNNPLVWKRVKSLLDKSQEIGGIIHLPGDVVIGDKFGVDAVKKDVVVSGIPDDSVALDIGPRTIKSYCQVLNSAKTILWNGPMGVFEYGGGCADGTKGIAEKLAELTQKGVTTIVAGGSTVAAVEKLGYANKMSHVSMGGVASLELLGGKRLSGVQNLDDDESLSGLFIDHVWKQSA